MSNASCLICKIAGALVIIGALNWGLVGAANMNVVEQVFGYGTTITKVIYILVGVSGLAILASCFKICPGCKKA